MASTLLEYSKGITHKPSDFLATDGELEECVNLEVVGGELKTAEMPVGMGVTLASNAVLRHVHTNESGLHNYIYTTTSTLQNPTGATYDVTTVCAFHMQDGIIQKYSFAYKVTGQIKTFCSLGNILMALAEDSMYYFLWSESDGNYSFIGTDLPELEVDFSLRGQLFTREGTLENLPYTKDNDYNKIHLPDFSSEANVSTITQSVLALVNKLISDQICAAGHFIYPFLIRWAYRMFDGTNTHQSAPILMLPSTYVGPVCGLSAQTIDADDNKGTYKAFASAVAADVSICISSGISDLAKWSDLIQGIDVFISAPIQNYDQSGDVTSLINVADAEYANHDILKSFFVGEYSSAGTISSGINNKHMLFDIVKQEVSDYSTLQFVLPGHDLSDIYDGIRNCSNFYKYCYIPLDSITEYTSVKRTLNNYDTLTNTSEDTISVQNTLEDDYLSHHHLVPGTAMVYNKRLNVADVKYRMYRGFSPRSMMQYTDTYSNLTDSSSVTTHDWQAITTVNGVTLASKTATCNPTLPMFLYYPDVNATKMRLVDVTSAKTGIYKYLDFELQEHKGLNGAFYFTGFDTSTPTISKDDLRQTDEGTVWSEQLNSLWLSEVSNPLRYDLNGMYTVGNGSIIAMAALVRPVSVGQYGEYPLMVFCTDGNYGMKVSDDGYYEKITPMQEDTALSDAQITSLEGTILFITKKGLMEFDGSNVKQLAAHMDGLSRATLTEAKADGWDIIALADDTEGFLQYLYDARMAYDYASERVFIYNTDKAYIYVLNMTSGTVTKIVLGDGEKVVAHVVDYPDVILQTSVQLYSLYQKEDVNTLGGQRKGFALTRPLKLSAPMTLKVVERVKNLFAASDGDSSVKYALFGSNDNLIYTKVTSRFGRPFKYYKLALYTNMLPGESLSATHVETSLRRNDKLR